MATSCSNARSGKIIKMEFDKVLTRAAGPEILAEVVAMTSHRTVRATGVSQSGATHFQFNAEIDCVALEWNMIGSGGLVRSFRDGVINLPPDPPYVGQFPSGMPHPLRMMHPDQLLVWGRGKESFHPILAQQIGTHSILLTFEHREDPAFRSTMVIDRALGVVRKTAMLGDITILTEIAVDEPLVRPTSVDLAPISDWIRPDY